MNPSNPNRSGFLRALISALLLGCAVTAHADVVTDWNATIEAAMRNPSQPRADQARTAAIVHAAIFDAVNGIAKKYEPFHVADPAPAGARAEAAAVQAAYTALVGLIPAKKSLCDAQLAASLAQIPGGAENSPSVSAGRAWGERVAQQILAWRADDSFAQNLPYAGNTGAGHWRHAPLGTTPAAGTGVAATAPFALANPAAFDPGPPYGTGDRAAALASTAYAADVNEVKARGGRVSAVRTPAQADLAALINIVDVIDINAIVRRALPAQTKLVENARAFALLNLAAVDATIVVLQSKYKYGLWRPFQAINFADEDGNPATIADPAWVPLGATPPHPEYLSGHSGITSAMAGMAAAILGDDTTFTLSTSAPGAPSITPTFTSFSALADATNDARVNIGFHFRSCCELSQRIGYQVAGAIAGGRLQPVRSSEFLNVSLRGMAGRPGETMIAGFVIDAAPKQVLMRGVGPGLQVFGVAGALADPTIVLHDGAGRVLATNDNWSATGDADTALLTDAVAKVGAFPLATGSRDAALLRTLSPGAYTVHVSGAGGTAGISLVEIYHVP
jgi:hypothetical protein